MTAIVTQKFLRKPLYVDAVRITTSNFNDISEWCQGEIERESNSQGAQGKKYIKVRVHNPKNLRQSMAFVGDWLLYTERGYKVYTDKAFHLSFDKVTDEAEDKESDNTEDSFPLFFIDPETGFLTDQQPHEGARALTFQELMAIITKEIYSERYYARIEAAQKGKPDPITPPPVTELVEATPESIAQAVRDNEASRLSEETPDQDEQMPSEPAGVTDTNVPVSPTAVSPVSVEPNTPSKKDKYVLSRKEQREMSSEEIRDLVQGGEVLLEQDLQ